MALENPNAIIYHLRRAVGELSLAHGVAGETEGNRTNLSGPVRDAIYGLNTTVDALVVLIENAHIDGDVCA